MLTWPTATPLAAREIAKTRPAVVVSLASMNAHLDKIVFCALTTRLRPRSRSRVRCACPGRKAEIAINQIRTISTARLSRRLDRLEPSTAAQVPQTIAEMYGA
jgi:mRNA-degrading endonuclease toxin of MazEF toxin-antitoxin module